MNNTLLIPVVIVGAVVVGYFLGVNNKFTNAPTDISAKKTVMSHSNEGGSSNSVIPGVQHIHALHCDGRGLVAALPVSDGRTATLTSYAACAMASGLDVIREIVSGPRDGTRLDSLQVLTKWINVTPKAADAQQSDRGARKG